MATYYFSSSTGNNTTGAGTAASPWYSFYGKKNTVDALSAGDICLFKAGDVWYGSNAQISCLSTGTASNYIVFDRYGNLADADPVFCGASITTGWTLVGTSTDAGGGSIYYKDGLSYPYTIGVDGTSALALDKDYVLGSSPTDYILYSEIQKGTFCIGGGTRGGVSGRVYINLADGSNPSGHTIYCHGANWYSNTYKGLINAGWNDGTNLRSNGNYTSFNNLKVLYPNRAGFSSSSTGVRFYDCESVGSAYENFLFLKDQFGSNAQYTRAYRCTGSYANASGTTFGQGFTSSAPYTWFIDCVSHDNRMAGFDFLDYNSNNDCTQSGMVYCTSYRNGQTPRVTGYDPGIYVDGAHDILVYGCKSYDAGKNSFTGSMQSQNSLCFKATTEHQNKPMYNIHVVNNLFYNASGYNTEFHQGGDSPAYTNAASHYGCTFVNNTVIQGEPSGSYGGAFRTSGTGTSVRMIIKGNIFYKTTGSSNPLLMWCGDMNDTTKCDIDYNCYYNAGGSGIFSTTQSSPISLATWLTNVPTQNTHSIQSNPLLINTSFTAMDAHLTQATSPCVNAGLNTPWTPPQWVIDAGVLADNGAVVGSTNPTGVSDSGTMDIGYHYYNPTPNGTLTATNVQPATLYLGTTNTVTISFTTATIWPAAGKVVITFPTTLGGGFSFNSGGTSAATFTVGGSGALTVSYIGSVLTLTRSGGSDIAASTAVTMTVTYVLNPPQVGSTGAYEIKTTTSADATIDIDSSVSADQIIEPASTYKTITMSGVTLSKVSVMS